jgi:hypothetical protein
VKISSVPLLTFNTLPDPPVIFKLVIGLNVIPPDTDAMVFEEIEIFPNVALLETPNDCNCEEFADRVLKDADPSRDSEILSSGETAVIEILDNVNVGGVPDTTLITFPSLA